jgi:ATP-dependent Clp protease protease subunit
MPPSIIINKKHKSRAKNENGIKSLAGLLRSKSPDFYEYDASTVYEYYLSDQIVDPDEYTEMIHTIRNCKSTDFIVIHINCPGGNLLTTVQILHAMSECQGRIVASVEGACISAATLIFLAADEYVINEHSMFLFHNYSGGTVGKGGEMYHSVIYERKWSEDLLRSSYSGFLTNDEITDLLNDKDIWMSASEVASRIEEAEKKTKEDKEPEKEEKKPKRPRQKQKSE